MASTSKVGTEAAWGVLEALAERAHSLGSVAASAVCAPLPSYPLLTRAFLRTAWEEALSVVRLKLDMLTAAGDYLAALAKDAHLAPAEWRLLDAALLFDDTLRALRDEHAERAAPLRALVALFHLVQLEALEDGGSWAAAAEAYERRGRCASAVLLQRRWHELKQQTRRRLAAGAPVALHAAVARRYPHVAAVPLPTWRALVAAGRVRRAEREDDLILVEREIETVDLLDDDEPADERGRLALQLRRQIDAELRQLDEEGGEGKGAEDEGDEESRFDAKLLMTAVVPLMRVDAPHWRDLRPPPRAAPSPPAPKRVSLPDIAEVRRVHRRMLTAQVAPLAAAAPGGLRAHCCPARYHRAVNEARRRLAARAGRPPPAEAALHAARCRPPCACCCPHLLRAAAEPRALRLRRDALLRSVRDALAGRPPRLPKLAPAPEAPEEAPAADPLQEWIRQKTLTARFFDLNLKRPAPAPPRLAAKVFVAAGPPVVDLCSSDEETKPIVVKLPSGVTVSRIVPREALAVRPVFRPIAPAPARAAGPSGVRPSAPSSVRPSAPSSVRPSASSSVRPSAPSSVRPSAPLSVRPSAPSSVRPSAPSSVRPSLPSSARPKTLLIVRPLKSPAGSPGQPLAVRVAAPRAASPPARPSAPALLLNSQLPSAEPPRAATVRVPPSPAPRHFSVALRSAPVRQASKVEGEAPPSRASSRSPPRLLNALLPRVPPAGVFRLAELRTAEGKRVLVMRRAGEPAAACSLLKPLPPPEAPAPPLFDMTAPPLPYSAEQRLLATAREGAYVVLGAYYVTRAAGALEAGDTFWAAGPPPRRVAPGRGRAAAGVLRVARSPAELLRWARAGVVLTACCALGSRSPLCLMRSTRLDCVTFRSRFADVAEAISRDVNEFLQSSPDALPRLLPAPAASSPAVQSPPAPTASPPAPAAEPATAVARDSLLYMEVEPLSPKVEAESPPPPPAPRPSRNAARVARDKLNVIMAEGAAEEQEAGLEYAAAHGLDADDDADYDERAQSR